MFLKLSAFPSKDARCLIRDEDVEYALTLQWKPARAGFAFPVFPLKTSCIMLTISTCAQKNSTNPLNIKDASNKIQKEVFEPFQYRFILS